MPLNLSPGLKAVKQAKQDELRDACKEAIIAGFEHNGVHYSCCMEDQLNLMHSDYGGELHKRMRVHIEAQRTKLRALSEQVSAAKTDAEVLVVGW